MFFYLFDLLSCHEQFGKIKANWWNILASLHLHFFTKKQITSNNVQTALPEPYEEGMFPLITGFLAEKLVLS